MVCNPQTCKRFVWSLKSTLSQNAKYPLSLSQRSLFSQPLIYSILSCVRTWMNKNSSKYHFTIVHLRIRDHTTWFGGVLGRPSDTFLWALPISWSRLLARVWSGPMIIGAPFANSSSPIGRFTANGNGVAKYNIGVLGLWGGWQSHRRSYIIGSIIFVLRITFIFVVKAVNAVIREIFRHNRLRS